MMNKFYEKEYYKSAYMYNYNDILILPLKLQANFMSHFLEFGFMYYELELYGELFGKAEINE